MSLRLVAGNTGYIEIYNLVNAIEPAIYINTATITATITDLSGIDLAGSIVLNYVAASSGRYVGTIPFGVGIVPGQYYNVRIFSPPVDPRLDWSKRIKAEAGTISDSDEDCSC